MSVKLDPLVEGYLAYLRDVARKAAGTQRDTRCTLKRACEAMKALRPDLPLWKVELADFQKWLETERSSGQSDATIAKRLSHVRGFLDYAWRSGRSDRNVLDGFAIQCGRWSSAPKVLSVDEALALVNACPASGVIERRDRAMVLVFYGCGLRTAELCALSVDDVDLQRAELKVRGKGDKERKVPIPEAVVHELTAYLLTRGKKRGRLFRTQGRGKGMNAHEATKAVREAAERAGLSGRVTPKTLRHSYATHLMERGADLAVISVLMGHRGPSETGVYLHALGEGARAAVEKLDERRRNGGKRR